MKNSIEGASETKLTN